DRVRHADGLRRIAAALVQALPVFHAVQRRTIRVAPAAERSTIEGACRICACLHVADAHQATADEQGLRGALGAPWPRLLRKAAGAVSRASGLERAPLRVPQDAGSWLLTGEKREAHRHSGQARLSTQHG